MGPSKTDAVWVYNLTYGGGIVSVCAFLFHQSVFACELLSVLFSGLIFFLNFFSCFREILFHVSLTLEMAAPLS